MGYKSVINSAVSAANKAAKEAERKHRREARVIERREKKISKTNEYMEKIYNALEDEYAKGKIDKNKFVELKERKIDICMEYIIIGKSPFINLAKRYITGKIEHDEFDQISRDILPPEMFEEKNIIANETNEKMEAMKIFRSECKDNVEGQCQKCAKPKSFFSPLNSKCGLRLCKKCNKELNAIKHYGGYNGEYYNTASLDLIFENIDNEDFKIPVHFNSNLL